MSTRTRFPAGRTWFQSEKQKKAVQERSREDAERPEVKALKRKEREAADAEAAAKKKKKMHRMTRKKRRTLKFAEEARREIDAEAAEGEGKMTYDEMVARQKASASATKAKARASGGEAVPLTALPTKRAKQMQQQQQPRKDKRSAKDLASSFFETELGSVLDRKPAGTSDTMPSDGHTRFGKAKTKRERGHVLKGKDSIEDRQQTFKRREDRKGAFKSKAKYRRR